MKFALILAASLTLLSTTSLAIPVQPTDSGVDLEARTPVFGVLMRGAITRLPSRAGKSAAKNQAEYAKSEAARAKTDKARLQTMTNRLAQYTGKAQNSECVGRIVDKFKQYGGINMPFDCATKQKERLGGTMSSARQRVMSAASRKRKRSLEEVEERDEDELEERDWEDNFEERDWDEDWEERGFEEELEEREVDEEEVMMRELRYWVL